MSTWGLPVPESSCLPTEGDASRWAVEKFDAVAVDPDPDETGPGPRGAQEKSVDDVGGSGGIGRSQGRLELTCKRARRGGRSENEQPRDGRQRPGSGQVGRPECGRLVGGPPDLLFEPSEFGIGLGGHEEILDSTFEDDIDHAPHRPRHRDFDVCLPPGIERPKEPLHHASLMAIGQPGARARKDPDRNVRSEGDRDRRKSLHGRVACPRLDAGVVGPVDAGQRRDRAVGCACIQADPREITTERTLRLARLSLEGSIDARTALRRWHTGQ
jgi:hypothetical protein